MRDLRSIIIFMHVIKTITITFFFIMIIIACIAIAMIIITIANFIIVTIIARIISKTILDIICIITIMILIVIFLSYYDYCCDHGYEDCDALSDRQYLGEVLEGFTLKMCGCAERIHALCRTVPQLHPPLEFLCAEACTAILWLQMNGV